MLGSRYVIEHVAFEHNKRFKEEAYRIYVTDSLKGIAERLGLKFEYRYAELIQEPQSEEEKTGDEIALEVIQKLGLKGEINGTTGFSSEDIA